MGDEIDAILKQLMSGLRGISSNTLLVCQLEALKYLLGRDVSAADLRSISTRFVLLHPIKADTRSFAGFFRHAMLFALTAPPARLRFLDAIVPFVQRASMDDIKQW